MNKKHDAASPPLQAAPQAELLREALETLRVMHAHFRQTLSSGRARIVELGGECDSLEVMTKDDPCLKKCNEVLAKLKAALSPPTADQPLHADAGLLRDAMRYRWLRDRDRPWFDHETRSGGLVVCTATLPHLNDYWTGDSLDAAIDAALSAVPPPDLGTSR